MQIVFFLIYFRKGAFKLLDLILFFLNLFQFLLQEDDLLVQLLNLLFREWVGAWWLWVCWFLRFFVWNFALDDVAASHLRFEVLLFWFLFNWSLPRSYDKWISFLLGVILFATWFKFLLFHIILGFFVLQFNLIVKCFKLCFCIVWFNVLHWLRFYWTRF